MNRDILANSIVAGYTKAFKELFEEEKKAREIAEAEVKLLETLVAGLSAEIKELRARSLQQDLDDRDFHHDPSC